MAGGVELEHKRVGPGAEDAKQPLKAALNGPDVAEGKPGSQKPHDLLVGPLGVAVDEGKGVGIEIAPVEGFIKLV